jgi:malonyl-CoA decarboxylase
MQKVADRSDPSFPAFAKLVSTFSRRGHNLLERLLPRGSWARPASSAPAKMDVAAELARALLSTRGEASGVAIAQDLLHLYGDADSDERRDFFLMLADKFDPDPDALLSAWMDYQRDGKAMLPRLARAVEAPRQELFRRLNLAPGGTAMLVKMRADLLICARADRKTFDGVDADLSHLLQSWFNRGFLSMRPINWHSPASLLERVIRYEAVHDIDDWDDLRRRLDPTDRRCFGFFHPAMPDEPLIFVEVALTSNIPDSIQDVLAVSRTPIDAASANTAVFYSISNCQDGLRGISLGHFLIRQVANDLKRELPELRQFVTLSPMPGFTSWLARNDEAAFAATLADRWWEAEDVPSIRATLLARGVDYLADAKSADGRPIDPVARFHLGNGARLERLNWLGDMSTKGMKQSAGLMVNYLYEPSRIEENHEAYAEERTVIVSPAFAQAAQGLGRSPHVKAA